MCHIWQKSIKVCWGFLVSGKISLKKRYGKKSNSLPRYERSLTRISGGDYAPISLLITRTIKYLNQVRKSRSMINCSQRAVPSESERNRIWFKSPITKNTAMTSRYGVMNALICVNPSFSAPANCEKNFSFRVAKLEYKNWAKYAQSNAKKSTDIRNTFGCSVIGATPLSTTAPRMPSTSSIGIHTRCKKRNRTKSCCVDSLSNSLAQIRLREIARLTISASNSTSVAITTPAMNLSNTKGSIGTFPSVVRFAAMFCNCSITGPTPSASFSITMRYPPSAMRNSKKNTSSKRMR